VQRERRGGREKEGQRDEKQGNGLGKEREREKAEEGDQNEEDL